MTEPLYLIAHKVRNHPAFDIAIQMEMEDEVWWIIPTSGHRAYPYWNSPLSELTRVEIEDGVMIQCHLTSFFTSLKMPSPWPDHYWQPGQTSNFNIPETPEGQGLLQALGLRKPAEPLRRRI